MNGVPSAFAEHPNVQEQPSAPIHPAAHHDSINATQALIERFEAHLTPPGPTRDPNWYGWVPLKHHVFMAGMLQARQILGDGQHRFLDVGSGIGTKLILAFELGFKAAGVERWEPYIAASRQLAPFALVYPDNAEGFPFYHNYDLVYYYGLAPDMTRDGEIKRSITDRMKPGALLFTARRPFPDWLEHVGGLIWRKP
jgi:SAM-dependent methyltransferase